MLFFMFRERNYKNFEAENWRYSMMKDTSYELSSE